MSNFAGLSSRSFGARVRREEMGEDRHPTSETFVFEPGKSVFMSAIAATYGRSDAADAFGDLRSTLSHQPVEPSAVLNDQRDAEPLTLVEEVLTVAHATLNSVEPDEPSAVLTDQQKAELLVLLNETLPGACEILSTAVQQAFPGAAFHRDGPSASLVEMLSPPGPPPEIAPAVDTIG